MSFSLTFPKLLQPDLLRQLNSHLVQTTGCFAFLKTDQVLFSTTVQSWQDAYTVIGIGLYAIYHDYGCKFLRYLLLSDKLCPNTLPKPVCHRNHVDTLCQEIRPNLAHGILLPSERVKLQRRLATEYLNDSTQAFKCWPNYVNQITEEQWMRITQRLIADSDSLYSFLWEWGSEWAKNPHDLPQLRKKFSSFKYYFSKSFDDRICRPLLVSNGVSHSDVKRYTGRPRDPSAPINRWCQQLIRSYCQGKRDPEDLYQELRLLIQQELFPPRKSSVSIASAFGFI